MVELCFWLWWWFFCHGGGAEEMWWWGFWWVVVKKLKRVISMWLLCLPDTRKEKQFWHIISIKF
jgi:hypothetical protein